MNVLVNEDSLKSIADAIREKNSSTTTYKPAEMAPAIQAIEIGKKSFTVVQAANEVISITAASALTNRGNDYTLTLPTIAVSLNVAGGYTIGSLTVDGVDQGTNSIKQLQVIDGMVISATAATEIPKTTLTFNLLATSLHKQSDAVYSLEIKDQKDTTGKYNLSTLIAQYTNNQFMAGTYISAFNSQTETKMTLTQGKNTYSGDIQYNADTYSSRMNAICVITTDSNFDPTQPFDLVIEVTGALQ